MMMMRLNDDDGDHHDDDDDDDDLDAEWSYKALLCKILECSHGSAWNACSMRSPAFARS